MFRNRENTVCIWIEARENGKNCDGQRERDSERKKDTVNERADWFDGCVQVNSHDY